MYISLGNLLTSQTTSKEKIHKITNVSVMRLQESALNKTAWATGELKEGKGSKGSAIMHSRIHRKHVQLKNLHAISLHKRDIVQLY